MNILKYPEEADPGATLTKGEFEELAIQTGLMEDMMDRTDLEPHDFIEQAINRANSRRGMSNLHLWAADVNHETIHLVSNPLAMLVRELHIQSRMLALVVAANERQIRNTVRAGR